LRRLHDTVQQVCRDLDELRKQDENLRQAVEQLRVHVDTVQDMAIALEAKLDTVIRLSTGINGKAEKLSSFKTFAQFAGAVIVPILVAIIGVYIAIRTQLPPQ
jgi:ABC-type transporter Mla subunit MlaD